jgi:YihY family inner membrane protein
VGELEMQAAERLLRLADRQHQRRAWIAFPYAVMKKYGDDQAGNLAALIAYYGFLSLFPLMLVLVTLLGMLLHNHPGLQDAIQTSALANFPVIGKEISGNVHSLRGSGLALCIGLAVALWAGIGVVKVLQTAMNAVWNVPYRLRPNVWVSLLRAMLMLVVLGVITIASAAAGSVGAGSDSWLLGIAGIAISIMLNMIMFLLAFRILTTENVTWGDVFPGASVAALVWTVLQALGGYIVSHQLQGASDTYGTTSSGSDGCGHEPSPSHPSPTPTNEPSGATRNRRSEGPRKTSASASITPGRFRTSRIAIDVGGLLDIPPQRWLNAMRCWRGSAGRCARPGSK